MESSKNIPPPVDLELGNDRRTAARVQYFKIYLQILELRPNVPFELYRELYKALQELV